MSKLIKSNKNNNFQKRKLIFDAIRTFFWGTLIALVPAIIVRMRISEKEKMPVFEPITWQSFSSSLPWIIILWIISLIGFWYYFKNLPTLSDRKICQSCGKIIKSKSQIKCECGGHLVEHSADID